MLDTEKMLGVRGNTLSVVTFMFILCLTNAFPISDSKLRTRRQATDELMRKTFDFGTTCRGNIILTLGGRQINQRNLQLSPSDVALLEPVLYDQPLEDRVDVWCKVAEMTQELAASIGRQINIFDIEDLRLFQGDILLTSRTVDAAVEHDPSGRGRLQRTLQPTLSNPVENIINTRYNRFKRKVISNLQYKWDDAIVPWRFMDTRLDDSDKAVIREGIASWEQKTCLRFPENNNPGPTPHINFIKGNGCYSYIGKDPRGQPVSIGRGCGFLGIVVHEIGHAIGLSHEQSRPDRNRYVTIDSSNVWPGFLGNFIANSWSNYHTDGIPYDFASVMHYAAKDFASVRTKDTVISLDPEMKATMGQRNDLSFWDAKVSNRWYCTASCPGFASLAWSACKNEGYRNPNKCNECLCPEGLAPPFCDTPIANSVCGNNELVATNSIQTFTSPEYNGVGYPVNTECAFRIKAPDGMRVKLRMTSMDMQSNSPACRAFVEVRYRSLALAGPRFCGSDVPTREFVSHGSEMMVTSLSKADQYKGFQFEYSAESCGGCAANSANTEPACFRTVFSDCMTEGQDNICFDVQPNNNRYCCGSYQLQGDNCVGSPEPQTVWGPWSDWSLCSRECGACGRQYRTRKCNIPSQCGNEPTYELRACNVQDCVGVTPPGFCDQPRLL